MLQPIVLRAIAVCGLLGWGSTAWADTFAWGGVAAFSKRVDGNRIQPQIFEVGLGYRFAKTGMVEHSVGLGVGRSFKSESEGGVEYDLDGFVSLAYQPLIPLNQDFGVFGLLEYTYADIEGTDKLGVKSSEKDSSVGVGVGVKFKNLYLSFSHVQDVDLIALNYRFNF